MSASSLRDLPLPPLPVEAHLRPGGADLRRRLALWIGLPALLVALYALAGGGAQVSGAVSLAMPLGFLLVAASLFALSVRQMRAFTRDNAAAAVLVYRGELGEACRAYEENARRHRLPALHPISVFNLADTELLRGELRRALSLAAAVAGYRGALRSPLVAATAPALVATCYALLGELESAKAWLPEAERAGASLAIEAARVPEAIVACREGRWADVVRRYSERRRPIEATLAGEELRTLRLLRAMALSRMPQASEEERAEALAIGRPAPGESDHLGVAWPQMREFLSSIGATGKETR